MLVRITCGKDLYYPGELVSLPRHVAETYISAGVAEPALCPECEAQLEARGWGAVCPECGNKKWESIC